MGYLTSNFSISGTLTYNYGINGLGGWTYTASTYEDIPLMKRPLGVNDLGNFPRKDKEEEV
jgi:hypothetical protein